jgi:Na+-transporting NADH:ubiquinone oxidoreductase subunit C
VERAIRVIRARPGRRTDPSKIDGLSGATVTSNAVTRLIQFWLSDEGYGKFLRKFREGALA